MQNSQSVIKTETRLMMSKWKGKCIIKMYARQKKGQSYQVSTVIAIFFMCACTWCMCACVYFYLDLIYFQRHSPLLWFDSVRVKTKKSITQLCSMFEKVGSLIA